MEKICPIMSTGHHDDKCVKCMPNVCALWDESRKTCGLCARGKRTQVPPKRKAHTDEENCIAVGHAWDMCSQKGWAEIDDIARYLRVDVETARKWLAEDGGYVREGRLIGRRLGSYQGDKVEEGDLGD